MEVVAVGTEQETVGLSTEHDARRLGGQVSTSIEYQWLDDEHGWVLRVHAQGF